MSRYNIVSTILLVLFIGSLIVDGSYDIPFLWYAVLVVLFVLFSFIGSIMLSLQFFVPVKSRVDDQPAIAITFDDGPIAGKTEKILDVLQANNLKALFFCIGKRIAEQPELLKRIHNEGHLVGNHSYSHGFTFDLQSSTTITKELAETDALINTTIGKKPKFFRPPYGVTNPMVAKAVKRRNYSVIGWSVRSFDTMISDPDKLLKRVTKSVKAGDIVLFHDQSESMIEMLPAFLKHVSDLGLKVVRVDELLNEKAYA